MPVKHQYYRGEGNSFAFCICMPLFLANLLQGGTLHLQSWFHQKLMDTNTAFISVNFWICGLAKDFSDWFVNKQFYLIVLMQRDVPNTQWFVIFNIMQGYLSLWHDIIISFLSHWHRASLYFLHVCANMWCHALHNILQNFFDNKSSIT